MEGIVDYGKGDRPVDLKRLTMEHGEWHVIGWERGTGPISRASWQVTFPVDKIKWWNDNFVKQIFFVRPLTNQIHNQAESLIFHLDSRDEILFIEYRGED